MANRSSKWARAWMVTRVIGANVDRMVLWGLTLGLVLGLGVATGSNLGTRYLISSYHTFVQHSLIGLQGNLVFKASSPSVATKFYHKFNNQAVHASPRWDRKSITLNIEQERLWSRKVGLILLNSKYLKQKLRLQPECGDIGDMQGVGFANGLFLSAHPGLDPSKKVKIAVPEISPETFEIQLACPFETGMATQEPLLVLPFEAVALSADSLADKIEIFSRDPEKIADALARFNGLRERMEFSTDQWIKAEFLIDESKQMAFARTLTQQVGEVSWWVLVISLSLSLVILVSGFLVVFEFKKEVLRRLWLLGVSRGEVALGFMIPAAMLGLSAAIIGVASTWGLSRLAVLFAWIPFPNFLGPFPWWEGFFLAVSLPVFVGVCGGLSLYWAVCGEDFGRTL